MTRTPPTPHFGLRLPALDELGLVGALEPFASAFPKLTRREHEVLALMAQQQSNQEVAKALSLSPRTVRNYTSSIHVGLQVADPAGAILKARDAAL